jgi:hypothetical protein
LVRLLLQKPKTPPKRPPKKPPALPAKVRLELAAFCRDGLTEDHFQATLNDLAAAGCYDPLTLGLTETGRARALKVLGLEALPAKPTWANLLAKYLLPQALEVPPDATDTLKQIAKADGLAALMLRRKHGVSVPGGANVTKTTEALACQHVCQALGLPPAADWKSLQTAVLGHLVGAPELTAKQVKTQVPRLALGVPDTKMPNLVAAVVRDWLDAGPAPASAPAPALEPAADAFDLPAFAATVLRAAAVAETGRFGTKVFVNHLWRQLAGRADLGVGSFPEFKDRLLEAHRAGLLELARADLVDTLDPEDVRTSEISYLNATYHFVLDEGARP